MSSAEETEKEKGQGSESAIKWISTILGICTFAWSIVSFGSSYRLQAESHRIEVRKPYLDRQLALYTEAVQVTTQLALTDESVQREKLERRFWELYWGELAMVENGGIKAKEGGVEAAMVAYGALLEDKKYPELRQAALKVAHACRDSLAESWGNPDWRTPVYTDGKPQ